ncbi:hypothetical protein ACUTRI_08350 [Serratia sp. TSA_130.2]|uniref:Uncharacterized protein n=1 Tax=Serratia ureilytica TaxID=300181 RepID=A0A9X9G0L4_9GAMM|nr:MULTISPECIES: hypothetical protein [Serratia]ASM10627.1 hypothetical protein BVG93_01225 [Serratia marcescens]MBH3096080.1 hypothetical protein [Serratia ureilytica]MBJ2106516.1 hypothetical protein [Serratia ureilytica]PKR39718.1 hypothetical protein CU560_17200 [Serratia ureilytica]TXE25088.1 hypothetical protein FOT63_22955 [Serratia ureilytica]
MKRIAAIIAGAIIGIGLMLLAFPFLSDWIIGHIEGEDQMSANFKLLAIGLMLCCFMGSALGNLAYSKSNNSPK